MYHFSCTEPNAHRTGTLNLIIEFQSKKKERKNMRKQKRKIAINVINFRRHFIVVILSHFIREKKRTSFLCCYWVIHSTFQLIIINLAFDATATQISTMNGSMCSVSHKNRAYFPRKPFTEHQDSLHFVFGIWKFCETDNAPATQHWNKIIFIWKWKNRSLVSVMHFYLFREVWTGRGWIIHGISAK